MKKIERERLMRIRGTHRADPGKRIEDATSEDVSRWLKYPNIIRPDLDTRNKRLPDGSVEKVVNYYLEVKVLCPTVAAAEELLKWGGSVDRKNWLLHSQGRIRPFLEKMNENPEIQSSSVVDTIQLAFKILDILKKKPAKRSADLKAQLTSFFEQLKKAPQWKGI